MQNLKLEHTRSQTFLRLNACLHLAACSSARKGHRTYTYLHKLYESMRTCKLCRCRGLGLAARALPTNGADECAQSGAPCCDACESRPPVSTGSVERNKEALRSSELADSRARPLTRLSMERVALLPVHSDHPTSRTREHVRRRVSRLSASRYFLCMSVEVDKLECRLGYFTSGRSSRWKCSVGLCKIKV